MSHSAMVALGVKRLQCSIQTHDPYQNLPQSYIAGPRQVLASHHRSSNPNTGSNSGGRWIKKNIMIPNFSLFSASNSFIWGKSIFSKFIEQPLNEGKKDLRLTKSLSFVFIWGFLDSKPVLKFHPNLHSKHRGTISIFSSIVVSLFNGVS